MEHHHHDPHNGAVLYHDHPGGDDHLHDGFLHNYDHVSISYLDDTFLGFNAACSVVDCAYAVHHRPIQP